MYQIHEAPNFIEGMVQQITAFGKRSAGALKYLERHVLRSHNESVEGSNTYIEEVQKIKNHFRNQSCYSIIRCVGECAKRCSRHSIS